MSQVIEVTETAVAPKTGRARRGGWSVADVVFGRPLRTDQERHERLNNPIALAVFASDALSSVAYATEEMLAVVLPVAAAAAYGLLMPLSGGIVLVLVILILSYRQTIKAYPTAGGAYMVTRDNFGLLPAQVAGVALLTDYVLTVAVSVSAGVAAMYSAVPALFPHRVGLACGFVILLAWMNLRGVRQSGRVLAVPTYGFVLGIVTLILIGAVRMASGQLHPMPPSAGTAPVSSPAGVVTMFLLLHAFASGSTAMTGVEAISNGVSAFKRVEWVNARRVLVTLGVVLATMFLGISFLASRLHPVIDEHETVVSQLARAILGTGTVGRIGFFFIQAMTMAVLVLAANTSFADFPRLANFHAADHFLPVPLTRCGRRLVFSNGIVTLAAASIALVVMFQAQVDRLIQLYVVGVFLSFTMSQAGMARHHVRLRERGWKTGLAINGLGAVATSIVLVVIAVTKFVHGAWAIILLIPILVTVFVRINHHYARLERLANGHSTTSPRTLDVVIFVDRLDHGLDRAMRYVDQLNPHAVRAIHVGSRNPSLAACFRARYGHQLEFVPRHHGSIVMGVRAYVHQLRLKVGDRALAVIVPEVFDGPRWLSVLRDQRTMRLKTSLLFEPGIMVINLPTHVNDHTLFDRLPLRHTVLVPIGDLNHATRAAVQSASLLGATEVIAIHIAQDRRKAMDLLTRWADSDLTVPLEVVDSPYREVDHPLLDEVRDYRAHGSDLVTVVLGELVPHWWQHALHSHHALELKAVLLFEPDVAVASLPQQL
jgi:amino acid transporter